MSKMVNFWIQDFVNSNRTIDEEIEDVKCTIRNEELWAKGSDGESAEMLLENIALLQEYLEWLNEQ